MKKLLLFLSLLTLIPNLVSGDDIYSKSCKKLPQSTHDYKITRVIDGDTVAFRSDFLPAPLKPELSIRIYGVDTPEKGYRAECESEAKQGKKASDFTKALVKNAKSTKIVIMKWDKYGGRILGDVILDGKSLTKQLLEKGYARKYCGGQKESWCK